MAKKFPTAYIFMRCLKKMHRKQRIIWFSVQIVITSRPKSKHDEDKHHTPCVEAF